MAVRFYGDFKNDVGVEYRINIYDNDYTGGPSEVLVSVPGFKLSYEGNNQEQYQPIIASRLEFTLYNEGGDMDTWLNTVLPSAEEGRFLVEVIAEPSTPANTYTFWRGVLLPERIQQADAPQPSAVDFSASDDLAQLHLTTTDDLGLSSSTATPVEYITKSLALTRCSSLYSTSDTFLRYANDFVPNDFGGSDLLLSIGLYEPVIAGTQPFEYYSAYDVLRSLAITFNARVFQAEGIWYFLPMNKYQQRSDGDVYSADLAARTKTNAAATWSTLDKISWISNQLFTAGTVYTVMAGNVIEYSRPVKRVDRLRLLKGNEWLLQGLTGFTSLSASTNDLELADDDRTYFAGSTHLVTLNYNIEIDDISSAPIDNGNYYSIFADFTIKFGDQYYTNDGWSGTAGTKRVAIGTYYAYYGFQSVNSLSVPVPQLVDDEVGLDVTLNVVIFGIGGSDQTGSLPTNNVYFIVRVYPGDGTEPVGDVVTFSSESSLDNQVTITQDNIVTGSTAIDYATGGSAIQWHSGGFFYSGNVQEWVSSQTTDVTSLHRLGVREILYNTQLPHRVRSGTVYLPTSSMLWPYHVIRESGENYVIHEYSYTANDSEVSVERFQLNASTANVSFRTDEVKSDRPDDRYAPSGSNDANLIATNFNNLYTGSLPQYVAVQQINHSSGSTHRIDQDSTNGFMYMNSWVDTATGYGIIFLPKVADNDGRMLRFKSDDTISANEYYRIGIIPAEYNNGVRIDGNSYFQMDRSYDGIAVLCYNGQWYVIQRKSK